MNSDLIPSLEATRFLAFRRQGGNAATLIQSAVQGQQAAFAQEVNQVASALNAQQTDYEQRADAVVRHVVALDLLTPQEERLEGLQRQAATLQEVQVRLRHGIVEKNERLVQQRQQLIASHKVLQQVQEQVRKLPTRYVGEIEAGGQILTDHISGIHDHWRSER